MGVARNPFFKNEKIAVEPHIMHKFDSDFYGEQLTIALCGYLRPERDFASLDALKAAIADDIAAADALLDEEPYLTEKARFVERTAVAATTGNL